VTRIVRVLAPNPGPYTLEGTNTWIVGDGPTVVIDPGPPDDGHVEEVARAAGDVAAIVLTHHHPDHTPAAPALAKATGAPVLSSQPNDGEQPFSALGHVTAGDLTLIVVPTPGHTSDHVAFVEPTSRALFTGDAVLGRGTSVVDPPDGDMAAYLASLRTMLELLPAVIYPGHGPAAWDGVAKLREYLEHRTQREREVLEGLRDGPRSPDELVPDIYRSYAKELYPAAARSVLAHLLKLESEGTVARSERADGSVAFARVGDAAVTT
jgi:glyoxylase-like metal-dependent hydrolase (beta-lactamase superfamily II)